MATITTTFRLPAELHEELRREAFEKKTSINEVAIERIQKRSTARLATRYSADQKVKSDFAVFERISRKYGLSDDAVALVREERDFGHD